MRAIVIARIEVERITRFYCMFKSISMTSKAMQKRSNMSSNPKQMGDALAPVFMGE